MKHLWIILFIIFPIRMITSTDSRLLLLTSTGGFTAKLDGTSTAPVVTRGYPIIMIKDTDFWFCPPLS